MLDIVKPIVRPKPDAIIIHAGTNDITIDQGLIRGCSENTQVLLFGIINREDGNHNDKISEINTRMASYSEGQGLTFINKNNIDDTCLNRGRLH